MRFLFPWIERGDTDDGCIVRQTQSAGANLLGVFVKRKRPAIVHGGEHLPLVNVERRLSFDIVLFAPELKALTKFADVSAKARGAGRCGAETEDYGFIRRLLVRFD